MDNFRHSNFPKYPISDYWKIFKVCLPVSFNLTVSFWRSKVSIKQLYYSINQQTFRTFFEKYVKMNHQKISYLMAIFIYFKCWYFLWMLNTVVLSTPTNHRIVSSTNCDHLRPKVANTVFTKSMLAHLLSTLNHLFEIIRVVGHLNFRCYTTWSWSSI